jgi:hypothetical protein
MSFNIFCNSNRSPLISCLTKKLLCFWIQYVSWTWLYLHQFNLRLYKACYFARFYFFIFEVCFIGLPLYLMQYELGKIIAKLISFLYAYNSYHSCLVWLMHEFKHSTLAVSCSPRRGSNWGIQTCIVRMSLYFSTSPLTLNYHHSSFQILKETDTVESILDILLLF